MSRQRQRVLGFGEIQALCEPNPPPHTPPPAVKVRCVGIRLWCIFQAIAGRQGSSNPLCGVYKAETTVSPMDTDDQQIINAELRSHRDAHRRWEWMKKRLKQNCIVRSSGWLYAKQLNHQFLLRAHKTETEIVTMNETLIDVKPVGQNRKQTKIPENRHLASCKHSKCFLEHANVKSYASSSKDLL